MTETTTFQRDPSQVWDWDRFIAHYQQLEQSPKLDQVRLGQVLRVALYARVSLEEQARGYSIQEQVHAGESYTTVHKWTVVDIYKDEGFSGTNARRPAFQRMLRDVRHGRIDAIVVHKIDRFYRNAQGMLQTYEALQRQGVLFTSLCERIDFSRPEGKLMLAMLSTLAEIYVTNLREETRKGKKGRARSGLWNGSIPFGYCRGNCSACTDNNGSDYCPEYGNPDRNHDPDVLVPHPIESRGVLFAFQQYAAGQFSDRDIAEMLNQYVVTLPDGTEVPLRSKGRNYRLASQGASNA